MTDPKGTWTDGGKVWEGEPATPAVGGEVLRAALMEIEEAMLMLGDVPGATLVDRVGKLISYHMGLQAQLSASQPASPLRGRELLDAAQKVVMRYPYVTEKEALEIAKAVLALAQPASPLRGREDVAQIIQPATAKVFHELWRSAERELCNLEARILEYANDLRRNSSGGDDYPWEYAKATADYLETLITTSRAAPPEQPAARNDINCLRLKPDCSWPDCTCPHKYDGMTDDEIHHSKRGALATRPAAAPSVAARMSILNDGPPGVVGKVDPSRSGPLTRTTAPAKSSSGDKETKA